MQYYSLRLTFFLEVAKKLSKFLRWFQTNWTMVPFFVDTIEEILRSFCGRFILNNVMSKTVKTVDLIKISMSNTTIHQPNVGLGFALRHYVDILKKKGEISDKQIARFKKDAKNFLATLANHIITKTPIQSYFGRCTRSVNLIYVWGRHWCMQKTVW